MLAKAWENQEIKSLNPLGTFLNFTHKQDAGADDGQGGEHANHGVGDLEQLAQNGRSDEGAHQGRSTGQGQVDAEVVAVPRELLQGEAVPVVVLAGHGTHGQEVGAQQQDEQHASVVGSLDQRELDAVNHQSGIEEFLEQGPPRGHRLYLGLHHVRRQLEVDVLVALQLVHVCGLVGHVLGALLRWQGGGQRRWLIRLAAIRGCDCGRGLGRGLYLLHKEDNVEYGNNLEKDG